MNENKPRRKKVATQFGINLKKVMESRGLTHSAVAEMAEVATSVINDWVGRDGSVPHDLRRVAVLAQRLGVSFEWLLLGQADQYREPTLADFFDEVPAEHLSGWYRIEAKRLVPRAKK